MIEMLMIEPDLLDRVEVFSMYSRLFPENNE
jgi:hypothetical protein